MTIELTARVEKELRDLAGTQSREISELVEEAIRQYLEAAAITDLEAAEVAEAQVKMAGEFRGVPGWKDGRRNALEGLLR